ncbi:MAG: methyltransferase regulatory domain-containing protein [Acidimicrobiales bacterium]
MQVEEEMAPPGSPAPRSAAFSRELTPTWLSTACLLDGHRPPDLDRWFRYVHLGCGAGATTNVVAAVHPEAEVWAWAARPADLEATRRLRDAAGLANVAVHERVGLPTDLGGDLADLIVVEDVLTSASDDLRRQVVNAIGRNLRPGGLACVTYKTTVGWTEIAPVQRIMRHVALRHSGDPDQLVASVLGLLEQLRAGGAKHLTERPAVGRWLDELATTDPAVIIADYLTDDLRPMSHAQVSGALREAGCDYVGSARLGDGLDSSIPPALQEVVTTATSPALRESYRDLAARPMTRMDLFRRGPSPMSAPERNAAIGRLRLVHLLGSDADGSAESVHATDGADPPGPADHVRALMDSGEAHPLVEGREPSLATAEARRLNAALEARHGASAPVVAVPALGGAVPAATDPVVLARLGVR